MQNAQQQPQQQTTTLADKVEILANLALFPALTIMVFLRRKVGYRFLSPVKIQVMVLILWFFAGFSTFSGSQNSFYALLIFAVAVLATGYVERWLAWRDIKRGVAWHSYSRGISWLNFLSLQETTIKRFVDPAVAAAIGVGVSFLLPWFGYWLVFSAICLLIFEASDYERSINRMLDQLDNLVESEVVGRNVEHYSREGKATERPLEETAGIPTGVSPDLAAAIARRQSGRPGMQATPPQQQRYTQSPPNYGAQQQPTGQHPQQLYPQSGQTNPLAQSNPQGYAPQSQTPGAPPTNQQQPTGQLRRQLPPDNLATP